MVLDIRYGGIMSRIDSTIYRLDQYLEGKVNCLLELEEKRLGYDVAERPADAGFGVANFYEQMVTSGHMGYWR